MMYTLITGGSSGIGKVAAEKFAKLGHNLLLVSNESEQLEITQEQLQNKYTDIVVHIKYIDLTIPDSCDKLYQYTKDENLPISILVNNAGFGTYGFYDEIEVESEVNMINLNVLAVYKLTRIFLKAMLAENKGQIINIASIAAFQPGPRLAAYSATKSFVLNYSRALNHELKLKKSKVRISTVCPTPVKTKFVSTAKMENSKLFDSWMVVTPEEVATTIIKSLTSQKDMIIPKKRFHYLNKISRRLPTSWLLKFSADQAS